MSVPAKVASDSMLMALGAGTLHWSMCEATIDALVAVVFHRFNGKSIEPELPRMLGRKLKFLRKGFRRLSSLQHLADEADGLFDRMVLLSEQRNLLIHGMASAYWTDQIQFTRLKITPAMHFVERHLVTHEQMQTLAMEVLVLGSALAPFAERITSWALKEHRDEPRSKVPN